VETISQTATGTVNGHTSRPLNIITDTVNGHGPRLRSLLFQWHLTERCDHACTHCYQGDPPADLSYDTLLNILDQFRALVRRFRSERLQTRFPAHINVTGGEPFLRGDFFDLLERFHTLRREFSFAILTSGSMIDNAAAKRLRQLGPGFVQVSMEGTPQTHDAIRGAGDYERVLNAIKCLKKAGVAVLVSFTAHRGNYREFADVAAACKRLGVKRVWADRFVPIGGAAGQNDLVLSAEETDELLSIMSKSRNKPLLLPCGTEVAMQRALQFRTGDGRPYRCQAGNELLTVMADATLVPCRRMPVPVGSLLHNSLEELYLESPLLRQLREEYVPEGCESCFYKQACRGGLRCLAYAMTGSLNAADPGCSLVKF